MKTERLEQVEQTQQKAVRFVRDVLKDDERARELDEESPESYADRKQIQIVTNPRKETRPMPRASRSTPPTRAELQERITELEDENQELQDKLDSIAEVVNDSDEEEEDDDGSDPEDNE